MRRRLQNPLSAIWSDCCFVVATAASIATAEPHLPSFAAKNALKRIGSVSVGVFPESEPSRKKNGPLKKYIKIGFCRNISNKYDSGGV